MELRDKFEDSGNWLFRWRSYVPSVLLLVLLLSLVGFHYPEGSHSLDTLWDSLCLVVAMLGLGIRFYTVGHAADRTSGRNTKHQVAAVLNTTGMYSIVRHPLYLGNFLIWLGLSLFPREWWCTVIIVLAFIVFYERVMMAEEEFLRQRFGEQFSEWAQRTPAFFPRFSQWRRPSLPFSYKKALRGEYTGFLGIIAIFSLLEVVGDYVIDRRLELDTGWAVLLTLGAAVYLVLRWMKHRKMLER
jgi:protein-S-isoprenylcysteine O-methyltransferase Ste14